MALRELLAELGIEVDTHKLEHANEKVEGFIEGLEKVAKGVAAAFAVKEVFEFAEGVAQAIHQVSATAAQLGIEADTVQEYAFAARAAGMSSEELLNSMGRLQVAAANAAAGGKEAAKAFNTLKVSVKDTNGQVKPADMLFDDVAEGIAKMTDPAKQAAVAVQLFGRQGRQLLPFLKRGAEGMKEMRREFAEFGGGYDDEAIEKAEDFEEAMAGIHVVVDGIKSAIVHGLFPVLSWIAGKAAIIGGWFVRMTKNTDIVRNSLILLGAVLTPLAWSMAAAFAPLLAAGAAIAIVVLLFDDLITMFGGGDSVIGEQIDKIFGKGTSAKVVESVRDAWVEVKDAFRDMWPYVKQVYEAMKWIVENAKSVGAVVGGALGDKLAQGNNQFTEQEGVDKNKASTTSNMIGLNAKALLEAKQRGEDVSNFHVPNIPKGMTQESALAATNAILPQVNRGDAGFTQFQSKYAPQAPAPSGESSEVHVHIEGTTNMKEHELKRAVAEGVHEGRQRANRSAKYAVTQAAQKP